MDVWRDKKRKTPDDWDQGKLGKGYPRSLIERKETGVERIG